MVGDREVRGGPTPSIPIFPSEATGLLDNRVFTFLVVENTYNQKKIFLKTVRNREKSQKRRKRVNSNCLVTGLFYRLKHKSPIKFSNESHTGGSGVK